jgi:putative hydrolase of the HAD superfamily
MNVVFDFGAVLFTWRPIEIVAEVFPDRAATELEAKQLAQSLFGHPDWHAFDRGLVEMDALIGRTASRLSLPLAEVQNLVQGIGKRLLPMQDTLEVLMSLHSKRPSVTGLYFLSNMPLPYARTLEQRHAFLKHFDGGIFSGDVRCSKPDDQIYSLLQSRYGLVPDSTVFIDDMQANVDAAQALGWRGIHFQSAAQLAEQLRLQFGL